jgi:hypothetical protein
VSLELAAAVMCTLEGLFSLRLGEPDLTERLRPTKILCRCGCIVRACFGNHAHGREKSKN